MLSVLCRTLYHHARQELEVIQHKRIRECGQQLGAYGDTIRTSFKIPNACLDGIASAVQVISPSTDTRQYAGEFKTGFPVPADLTVDDLLTGPVGGATTVHQINAKRVNKKKIFYSTTRKKVKRVTI